MAAPVSYYASVSELFMVYNVYRTDVYLEVRERRGHIFFE
jgi:hypothetical protein